jgi:GT2 family glycosyltransferase
MKNKRSLPLHGKKLTVSVVIPNINGETLLEKNLPKVIEAMGNVKNHIMEIIMVDNASIDGSVKLVNAKFPGVHVIRHKVDRGFSASVNTGTRAAKGDLIFLINTDVIPEKNCLEKVISDFDDKKVFAVSLREIGYGPAKATFTDGYIDLVKGEESNTIQSTFYVSGGSGVFRRNILMELGGMDEKLLSPFYWEDIDLGYRAAKRGYKLLWDPRGIVEHHHESTISKFPKEYVARVKERNQLLMLWKNVTSANLTRKHIAGLFSRLIKHPGYIRIILMALGRFSTVLIRRQKEIKECKISDEMLFSRYV